MLAIKPLREFTDWLAGLKDGAVRGAVVARWRVYFVQHGQAVVVLLCAGPKRTQAKDIKRAKALAARLD